MKIKLQPLSQLGEYKSLQKNGSLFGMTSVRGGGLLL